MQTGSNIVANWKFTAIFVIFVTSLGRSGQAFLTWTLPRSRILPVCTMLEMSDREHQYDPIQNTSIGLVNSDFDQRVMGGDPPNGLTQPGISSSFLSASDASIKPQKPSSLKKYHHLSVCMVPPESSVQVWENIMKCRTVLKDPGLYRWPPHANLLYPFIDLQSVHDVDTYETDKDILSSPCSVHPSIIHGLREACRQVDPFYVKLQQFGTFGSKKRGVLWLYPDSYHCDEKKSSTIPPLMRLQSLLVQSFPQCNDQNMKSSSGFNPHMTVSHFINHEDALAAQQRVEQWWPTDLMSFPVRHIYLLQRTGDSGQFLRVADIPLGSQSTDEVIIYPSPVPFLHMPTIEVDWVYEERMKLKERRNGQWRSRSRNKDDSRRSNSTSAGHDPLAQSD